MKSLTVVVAIAVSLALAASAVYGQDLYACKGKKGKTLRLVDSLTECGIGETAHIYTSTRPFIALSRITGSDTLYAAEAGAPPNSQYSTCEAVDVDTDEPLGATRDPFGWSVLCPYGSALTTIISSRDGLLADCGDAVPDLTRLICTLGGE